MCFIFFEYGTVGKTDSERHNYCEVHMVLLRTSPRRLPNTLSIEKIVIGNSALRNISILNYLDNMRFVDGLGRGEPIIRKEMGDRFHYSEKGELLRLTLDFFSNNE